MKTPSKLERTRDTAAMQPERQACERPRYVSLLRRSTNLTEKSLPMSSIVAHSTSQATHSK